MDLLSLCIECDDEAQILAHAAISATRKVQEKMESTAELLQLVEFLSVASVKNVQRLVTRRNARICVPLFPDNLRDTFNENATSSIQCAGHLHAAFNTARVANQKRE